MAIITVTTDFGLGDPFVGIMKGVMLGIAPGATLVDLSHEIAAQDILGAAIALEAAVDYFPPGTVHLAVVDPGVGSERAAVAVECDGFKLVGPDNGVFTLVLDRHPMMRAVSLINPAYHLKPASATFHGRDIFAPAAAHLASGVPLDALGEPIGDLKRISLPGPVVKGKTMELHVIHVDRFGNLVTDFTRQRSEGGLFDPSHVQFRIGEHTLIGVSRTYSDVPNGQPVAYFGSGGRLEIGIRNGSAAERFAAQGNPTINVSLPIDAKPQLH